MSSIEQQNVLAKPTFNYTSHDLFGPRPSIPAPDSLHKLSPEQYLEFDNFFNSSVNHKILPAQRIAKYLGVTTAQFTYHDETLTASAALSAQRGNCMSLAMLTTALADRAGVKIEYQLMDDIPVFEQGENIIFKGVHVRTKLLPQTLAEQQNRIYMSRPEIIIDYFPTGKSIFVGNLNKSEYESRYYLNRAADEINIENFDHAYWLVLEAFKLNDSNVNAFNTLAIIYKQIGAIEKAEEIYQFGIASLPAPLTLLKNYQVLLVEQRRFEEAETIGARLNKIIDPSPYRLQRLARIALETGQYGDAVSYYRQAIKRAPNTHELHYQLARAYSYLGQSKKSMDQMELAMNHTHSPSSRSIYQQKLDSYLLKLKSL